MESLILGILVVGIIYLLIQYEQKKNANKKLKESEIQLLIESCNNGNGHSCYQIGQEYRYVEGGYFENNIEKALEYFNKGCALNNDLCCMLAGGIYENTSGKEYNIDKAITCYKKSIQYGNSVSADSLARIYMEIKNDIPKAAKVLSSVCDKGDKGSCGRSLGFYGKIITKEYKDKVFNYYSKVHFDKCENCTYIQRWKTSQ